MTKTQVLGKLSVVTYDEIVKDLVIVPINGNKYPYNEGALRTQLNKIYGQAVVKWNITFAQNFDVPGIDPFDDGGSGLLSNYSPDMRKVVNAYKANVQRNTYYLFLVKNPKSTTLAGFMPRSKSVGFIFLDKNGSEEAMARTIAHELGHGAFQLRHTFADERNTLPKGTTTNLMDYVPAGQAGADGTKLYKYQWDRVRYREIVIGLFEGDEGGSFKLSVDLTGLTASVNEKVIEADKIFVIAEQNLKLNVKYGKENGGEVKFRLAIKSEGGGKEILYPSDDWKKVQNDENWVLELSPFQEGVYTLSYLVANKTTTFDFYIRNEAYDYACKVCGRNLSLTSDDFDKTFPNRSQGIKNDINSLTYLNEALKKGEFNSCYRQAHFLSQVYIESRGLNASVEDATYSVERILKVWKSNPNAKAIFFKQTFWGDEDYLNYASPTSTYPLYRKASPQADLKQRFLGKDLETFHWESYKGVVSQFDTVRIPKTFIKRDSSEFNKATLTSDQILQNKKNLLNLVYSNNVGTGNGNVNSGEGYKYRGRGAIQLTGKTTYIGVSNKCNFVFGTNYNWGVDQTSLETDNQAIIYSVASFFLWKLGNLGKDMTALDTNNVSEITKIVNGGQNDVDKRLTKFGAILKGRLNNCKIKK